MTNLLSTRRDEVQSRLAAINKQLADARSLVEGKACVYLTGSFGRGEASQYSDLDLFIVGKGDEENRALSRLDEILLQAALIKASRDLDFQEFSGDGEYLSLYSVDKLTKTLGKPEDDVANTFTARLLLLLESKALLGQDVYEEAIEAVIKAYWRDFEDHQDSFSPAFLANDIMRLWRTFCVNYEARTQTDPPKKKAKRKLKNYKLKHSRLLTCYSALAYLLAVYSERKTVTPDDARAMVDKSPTQRLEFLRDNKEFPTARKPVEDILNLYADFLCATEAPEADLIEKFLEKDYSRSCFASASQLGDRMRDLLNAVGDDNQLHRSFVG